MIRFPLGSHTKLWYRMNLLIIEPWKKTINLILIYLPNLVLKSYSIMTIFTWKVKTLHLLLLKVPNDHLCPPVGRSVCQISRKGAGSWAPWLPILPWSFAYFSLERKDGRLDSPNERLLLIRCSSLCENMQNSFYFEGPLKFKLYANCRPWVRPCVIAYSLLLWSLVQISKIKNWIKF